MSIASEVHDRSDPEAIPFGQRMTLEQWEALDEDVEGELVDGVLVEEEMASFTHEAIVVFLASLLRAWARPRVALIGGSESKFAVGPRRGRKPDVYAYLPGSKFPSMQASMAHHAPDVVVEVVSQRARDVRRDRVDKVQDYAAFGARSYWIVDPTNRTFEILVLGGDGKYVHSVAASAGHIDAVPLCEGLVIDLDAMWAEVDEIARATGEVGEEDA